MGNGRRKEGTLVWFHVFANLEGLHLYCFSPIDQREAEGNGWDSQPVISVLERITHKCHPFNTVFLPSRQCVQCESGDGTKQILTPNPSLSSELLIGISSCLQQPCLEISPSLNKARFKTLDFFLLVILILSFLSYPHPKSFPSVSIVLLLSSQLSKPEI